MKNILLVAYCLLLVADIYGQTVSQKVQTAFKQFVNDPQLKHAISSVHVVDAKTSKVVFSNNAQIGLVPASTQKIITAATAFELLGKDYRYKTELGYSGTVNNEILNGNLYVIGSGDPTLGSARWDHTRDSVILKKWVSGVKKLKVSRIEGLLSTNLSKFTYQAIPDGWIWQDIGNYYGAGSYALNWKENQYELILKSGSKTGGLVEIYKNAKSPGYFNNLKSAGKGTGDNAYIYYDNSVSGTIPVDEQKFSISGAALDPVGDLLLDLNNALKANAVILKNHADVFKRGLFTEDSSALREIIFFDTHYSPTLDSIIYWFLQKSVNLYGEAIIKSISLEKYGFGSADSGLAIVRDFWKQKGIDKNELVIGDGSGLSPQNRVTTHAQVEVLKYAKSRPWFSFFLDGLPLNNGMKMKSGSIKGVKGFSGYHTSKSGEEYIFSFVVNNFSGTPSGLMNKMYRVLDNLK